MTNIYTGVVVYWFWLSIASQYEALLYNNHFQTYLSDLYLRVVFA